ncbi:MAG: HyaD/HybD family hydrogenase maturation endopeptidase [Desulfomonilaceae bacterium]
MNKTVLEENIVVLGVGNILLKDEGVGVKTVEEIKRQFEFPPNVKLVDGGTQGLWLLPTIQEADHLIIVDAVLGKCEPGSIYRLERDDLPKGLRTKQSAHDSDLIEALNLCALLDKEPKTVVVIGVEPEDITPYGLDLTPKVRECIPQLIDRVLLELDKLGVKAQPV